MNSNSCFSVSNRQIKLKFAESDPSITLCYVQKDKIMSMVKLRRTGFQHVAIVGPLKITQECLKKVHKKLY